MSPESILREYVHQAVEKADMNTLNVILDILGESGDMAAKTTDLHSQTLSDVDAPPSAEQGVARGYEVFEILKQISDMPSESTLEHDPYVARDHDKYIYRLDWEDDLR